MNHNIREIYTKAVVAKGKKLSRHTYTITLKQDFDKVLGCFIMNHKYNALYKDEKLIVEGSFDVHLWLLSDYQTYVECHQVNYSDDIALSKKENRKIEHSDEIHVICLGEPKHINMTTEGNNVCIEVEKEMMAEITGETCIRVEVQDEEEIWDELDDINPYFIR